MKIKMLLTFLLFISSVFAQKTLTMKEAVQIALNKNSTLQKSVSNLKSFESGEKTAFGELLPSVNASIGWNWSKNSFQVNGTDVSSDSRSYSAGIRSDWTLFDGLSNYANLERSRNSLEAAQLNLTRLKQDIIFNTLSAYYDVINAKKLLQVREDDVTWNQKNYEIIVEKNRLGSVTLADVYAQQVRLGNAELEVIRAKNTYETLKSNFLFYLGLDVLDDYTLEEPSVEQTKDFESEMKNYEDIQALVNKALQKRPDVAGAKLSLANAELGLQIAKAGHYPRLSNSLSFGVSAPGLGLFGDESTKNYQANLTLSIPIFSGWSVENRVQLAMIDIKNSEIDLNDLNREIKKTIQKNSLDLTASFKRLDVSQKNVNAAAENRRIEEEKYSLGATTLLNVLIANSEYNNALTNLINAQYEYMKLKESMQYLLGELDQSKY